MARQTRALSPMWPGGNTQRWGSAWVTLSTWEVLQSPKPRCWGSTPQQAEGSCLT